MCRIAAFSSSHDIPIKPFLEKLSLMAKSGKKSPHPDGWGYFALNERGIVSVVRSDEAIFEREIRSTFKASILVAHARKASKGTPKTADQSHPLILLKDDLIVLAHNGLLKDAKKSFLGLDTEDIILEIGEKGVDRAIENLLKRRFSAINLVFFKKGLLYALRCARKNLDYYTLFLKSSEDSVIIYSERMEEGMEELENGEMIVARKGKVVERRRWECG